MKKTLSVLLAGLLAAGLLAACGGQPASSQSTPASSSSAGAQASSSSAPAAQPTTITIWHENDATIADTIQKHLDALAPDIVVKVERREKMSDALKLVGNDPAAAPDMYLFAHDKVGVFAQMGILAPVTDIVSTADMGDLLPMTVEAGVYGGSNYQLPIYFETLLFMYNKALMDAPPATTDELLQYMKDNTAGDMYGFVEMHSTAYYAAGWIQGYGGYIINADSEPGLDTPETIAAMEYHKQFIPYMPADGEYNTVTTIFREGNAHATIGGPWLVPDLKAAGIDLGIGAMPTLPSGKPITPFSGVQGVSVLKHAAEGKADAVKAVLLALTQPELGVALAGTANCAPANTKAYDDADVAANEMIVAMRDTAANVMPMPNVPAMDVMWTATEDMLVAINKNGGDVTAECEKAQKAALQLIADMQ